jgi:hypothetical protein
MSATNRSDVRLVDDAYATPAWCVERLLGDSDFLKETLSDRQHLRAMDPCAGSGAIVRACLHFASWSARPSASRTSWPSCVPWEWTLVEKRKVEKKKLVALKEFVKADVHIGNFLSGFVRQPVDLVITNPPYSLAQEFIETSMGLAKVAVVMLLRLNYLASERRSAFMRAHPPDVYVLPNRPSFTGKGTDATEYAWFVWPTPPDGLVRTNGNVKVLASTPSHKRSARKRPFEKVESFSKKEFKRLLDEQRVEAAKHKNYGLILERR